VLLTMSPPRGERPQLDAEAWRRIGAVLDRVRDVDRPLRSSALDEACRAEGIGVDEVMPFLDADDRSEQFPSRVEASILRDALWAFAADVPSARLAAGTRLGPYEILSLIGVGGMGEVYEARDTRLDRTVALKRLSPHVAASPEGRRRFEREARAASLLNHPHICTLHDVGSHEDVEFLVMEKVEGESLAARLRRGALPVAEVLQYATQMADALATAHGRGIVHRDLKPANVMLTTHGVKLLDFGLATLRPSRGIIEGGQEKALTTAGAILGTLQYMAPEQLQGRAVDERADVFALGAILYEMLTGRSAFAAESAAGVVAAVLARNPPRLGAERRDVPAALDWVVAQCLGKTADERWQSARDLANQLRWIEASGTVVEVRPLLRSGPGRVVAWLAAAAAAAAIAVAAMTYLPVRREAASAGFAYRLELGPPEGAVYEGLFSISSDGRRLAFTARDADGQRLLWVRPLEASTAHRVDGTNGALHPFWSPDGGSIGFFADRQLKIVDLKTRTVRVLTDAGLGGGGTWNADGTILFAAAGAERSPVELRRVSAAGGVATPVARLTKEANVVQAFPQFLPDGRHYLYMHMQPGTDEPGVYVGQLDGGKSKRVLPATGTSVIPGRVQVNGPLRATYAAGHIFYLDGTNGALMAQAFDAARLELAGEAIRVADDVENSAPGESAYDVAPTGVVAYRKTPTASRRQLAWFDRAGREIGRLGEPGPHQSAVLSRDGRYALVEQPADRAGAGTIVRIDVTDGTSSVLMRGQFPSWSPDGTTLAYSGGGGPFARVSSAEGSREGDLLFRPLVASWVGDWSDDGRHIVGTALGSDTGYDIFATVAGSGVATYPVASRRDETDPQLSPDGLWLAYAAADESARWDVYVRPFQRPGETWRVSRSGGRYPHWSTNGRELFYVAPDGTLMRTTVDSHPQATVTSQTRQFRRSELAANFNTAMSARPYSISRDDQKILVPVSVDTRPPAPLIVLTNWHSLVDQ
jgi:eukaryotic-like serine/threonine-protein kinase